MDQQEESVVLVKEEDLLFGIKINVMKLVELLVQAGVAKSNREARQLIAEGAIKINGKKIDKKINHIFAIDNKLVGYNESQV